MEHHSLNESERMQRKRLLLVYVNDRICQVANLGLRSPNGQKESDGQRKTKNSIIQVTKSISDVI